MRTLIVDSLTPDTEYIFRVSAANQYGIGKWSDDVYGETSSIEARSEGKKMILLVRGDFSTLKTDTSSGDKQVSKLYFLSLPMFNLQAMGRFFLIVNTLTFVI